VHVFLLACVDAGPPPQQRSSCVQPSRVAVSTGTCAHLSRCLYVLWCVPCRGDTTAAQQPRTGNLGCCVNWQLMHLLRVLACVELCYAGVPQGSAAAACRQRAAAGSAQGAGQGLIVSCLKTFTSSPPTAPDNWRTFLALAFCVCAAGAPHSSAALATWDAVLTDNDAFLNANVLVCVTMCYAGAPQRQRSSCGQATCSSRRRPRCLSAWMMLRLALHSCTATTRQRKGEWMYICYSRSAACDSMESAVT
jgi:hypothetical protein